MKIFILINALLEIGAGFILFFFPKVVPDFKEANNQSISWAHMYGAAALAIGFFAFYCWQYYEQGTFTRLCIMVLMVFHVGVSLAAFKGYKLGGFQNPAVTVLHGILALFSMFFFLQMGM